MVDVNALADALAGFAQSARSRGGRWDGNRNVATRAAVRPGTHAFVDTGPDGDVVYMHGPDGLFHVYDAEQPLISLQRYGTSLATELPSKASNMLYPLFGYIGGWGAGGGEDEPDGPCDPAPTSGNLYTCWQTAQFGSYRRQTPVMDVSNMGQFTGRSEFSDFLVINPAPDIASLLAPSGLVGSGFDFNREFMIRMMALGIEFERLLGPQVFYGNPDNSSTTPGGYAEYPGLDILIATGHMDALRSGVTCTGLDSLIYDYNYAAVDDSGGATIVTLLTSVMRYMRTLSRITNLDPVQWSFVMRDDLFNAICDVWPCAYLANRCAITSISGGDGTGAVGTIDLSAIVGLREAMRNGGYIEIDGMRVPVIRDSWIRERNNATNSGDLDPGQYASDIYLVPMTIRGNIASTYWEFLNWDGAPMQAITDARRQQYFAASDGGRWLWTLPPPTETCLSAGARVRPRIIELAPHLCMHATSFMYSPTVHQPDSNPSDSFYSLSGSPDPITFTVPISIWNP